MAKRVLGSSRQTATSSSHRTCGRSTFRSKFHDRAPKLVKDPKGGDAWELVPGTAPMPLGLVTNPGTYGKRYEELEWYGSTYDTILKGSFMGKARVEEQDFDGVDCRGALPLAAHHGRLHGARGRRLPPGRARGLQHLDARRVHGGRPEPPHRPGADARRGHQDGHQVAARRQGGRVQGRDHLGLPVGQRRRCPTRTILSGKRPRRSSCPCTSTAGCARQESATAGRSKRRPRRPAVRSAWRRWAGRSVRHRGSCPSSSTPGIFDRFPNLQMVAVECGAGWVPHFLEHMDDHYWRNRTWTQSHLGDASERVLPAQLEGDVHP